MTLRRKILLGLVFLLGALQFVRPQANSSPAPGANEISAKYAVPPDVQAVLQKACYDCHSNNTRYPWYAQVQPVGWWLADHIKEGKSHLNFSEFCGYEAKRAAKKLKQAANEVTDRDMPLKSYTWIHTDARLSADEAKLLVDWATALSLQINREKNRE